MDSVDDIKKRFNEEIADLPYWRRLVNSMFAEGIARFFAVAIRSLQHRIERAQQEVFGSTMLNRASLYAFARDKSYTPLKRLPSTGLINIENRGTSLVTLPAGMTFKHSSGRDYRLIDAVQVGASATATGSVEQVVLKTYTFPVSEQKKFLEIVLPKSDSKAICRFDVLVNGEHWEYRRKFRNTVPDGLAYDEFITMFEEIGILFGNGRLGRIPSVGDVITVNAWLTEGESTLLLGQTLSPVGDYTHFGPALTVTTQTAIQGGKPEEDLESIRNNAMYSEIYDDEHVWANDYKFPITQAIRTISWIQVWGEQEQEALYGLDDDHTSRIWISAYDPEHTAEETQAQIEAILARLPLLNVRPTYLQPNLLTYTIAVDAVIERDQVQTEVEFTIHDVLEKTFGLDASVHLKNVKHRDIYKVLEQTGYFSTRNADYDIAITGATTSTGLNDLVYLDLANSTINVSYSNV